MLRRKVVSPPDRSGIFFSKTFTVLRRQFKITFESQRIDRNNSEE